jgi:hypothetical protein
MELVSELSAESNDCKMQEIEYFEFKFFFKLKLENNVYVVCSTKSNLQLAA